VELVTHKALHFSQPRAEVWAAMADVESYRQWWPWLRAFQARALATDDVWRCTVRAPVGYTVSFAIAFTRVVDGSLAEARVSGDIRGGAELTLTDAEGGCSVVVRSDLQPESRFLRFLTRTVPAVARYGHDWVLATGAKQFEQRALLSVDARDTTT
jgi:uncharacterized protein YndB with AHSA1/START domain